MKNINEIINEIRTDANRQIINAVWDRVAQINNALDDANGNSLSEHYGSALHYAAEAVDSYMELVELCKQTTEQPLREHLRDALGSVKWNKFELPVVMMAEIEKARNEAANPKITRNPCSSFITKDPIEQVGLWCNEITRSLKGDYDGNIPFEKEFLRK